MNEVGDGAARGHAAAYSAAENKTTYQERFHPGQMSIPSIIRCLSLCEKSISTQPSPPLPGSRERQSGGQKTPEVLFMPILAPRVSPGRERGMVPQEGPGWPGGPLSQPKHKSPHREDQLQPLSPTSNAARDVGFKEERKGRSRIEKERERDTWDLGLEKGWGRGEERGAGIRILPDRAGRRSFLQGGERGCENGKKCVLPPSHSQRALPR